MDTKRDLSVLQRTNRDSVSTIVSTRRLNATRITSLAIGTYTDPGQIGLQLRVAAKRSGSSRSWLLRLKFRGQETRMLLGHFPETTLETARRLAREYREMASRGIDPRHGRTGPRRRTARRTGATGESFVEPAHDPHSIEFLVREFMERHIRPHRKSPEQVERVLNGEVLRAWRGRDARSIRPREIIELLDGIVERGSPVMANRIAGLLGQLFKFGIHRAIVDDTPVRLLMRPGGKERPRSRVLSDEELRIFLADPTAGTRFPRLAQVMLILLLTGQRRGELTLARWREIDFDAKTWRIPDENAKTRGHVLPLSDWAVRELRLLKVAAGRSAWVLPSKSGDGPLEPKLLTRGLAKCQSRFKRLGITRFTLHDLRRTCRTGLARLRIPPHVAERVLNHAQEKIPGTYDVHDYLDEKRAALDQWAAHLEQLAHADAAAIAVPPRPARSRRIMNPRGRGAAAISKP